MPCEDDFITCENKHLGPQQLLHLLLTEIAPGVPGIRVCDAGGGGAAALPIGNSVFVNPLGNDGTGAREDFHLPFLTLNAAKNAAVAGDTIYVFGGTYNEANTLHKDGVKWHFLGKPTLNVFASNVWHATVATAIEIAGDAIVNHQGVGSVIRVEEAAGPTTTVHADFHEVTGLGTHVLFFNAGSGIINIATKLEVTLVNRCIGLGGLSEYVFNIDDIFCNSSVGGVSNAINLRNQVPAYDGDCIFNCRTIRSGGGVNNPNGATISYQYFSGQGRCVFNVTDKIHFAQTGIPAHSNSAVQILSGHCVVNGDIDGGEGQAINMETQFNVKSIVHNGNAINDGTNPLVDCGDSAGFWQSGNATVTLNGEYESSNDKVIIHRGLGSNKFTINGSIISKSLAVTCYGLFLESAVGSTLLNSAKIVLDTLTGFGIGASVAKVVKIIHNVSSNVNVDGNITNAIAGTSYVQDPDVE